LGKNNWEGRAILEEGEHGGLGGEGRKREEDDTVSKRSVLPGVESCVRVWGREMGSMAKGAKRKR